jgi:hypothetical protein
MIQQILSKWRRGERNASPPEAALAPGLELISIHIPKTAGTSFRNTLKGVYGEQGVVRLDIDLARQEVRVNEQRYEQRQLPGLTRVAHGHFSYPLLKKNFDLPQGLPIITWLRDPAERVISNYFYLAKRLAEELEEERKGLNILSKMQRSLLEYAAHDLNQNRMSKFLEGLDLEDLFFVGIQEDYDRSLERLAGLLGWENYPVFHHNQTGKEDSRVSAEERARIRELNPKDVALYERALELLEKGRWKP